MNYKKRKCYEEFCVSPEHYIKCCDCGLVHKIKIRKFKGKFYMKAIRDNRRTGQARRFMPAFVKTVNKKRLSNKELTKLPKATGE